MATGARLSRAVAGFAESAPHVPRGLDEPGYAAYGAVWELDREGANHSLWRMNERKIAIPRHREIREGLARTILRRQQRRHGKGDVMTVTYEARVWRDGRLWAVDVDGVGSTQARHLREVETMACDLVALLTDQNPDANDVRWTLGLPAEVRQHLERAAHLREESAGTQAEATSETRAAACHLADAGLPMRDIGVALGVSHQRAHQLVRS